MNQTPMTIAVLTAVLLSACGSSNDGEDTTSVLGDTGTDAADLMDAPEQDTVDTSDVSTCDMPTQPARIQTIAVHPDGATFCDEPVYPVYVDLTDPFLFERTIPACECVDGVLQRAESPDPCFLFGDTFEDGVPYEVWMRTMSGAETERQTLTGPFLSCEDPGLLTFEVPRV